MLPAVVSEPMQFLKRLCCSTFDSGLIEHKCLGTAFFYKPSRHWPDSPLLSFVLQPWLKAALLWLLMFSSHHKSKQNMKTKIVRIEKGKKKKKPTQIKTKFWTIVCVSLSIESSLICLDQEQPLGSSCLYLPSINYRYAYLASRDWHSGPSAPIASAVPTELSSPPILLFFPLLHILTDF